MQCGREAQGCPLSPILFCLHISDLLPYTSESIEGVRIHNIGLLYVDDAVLLAENQHNMSLTLSILEDYCQKWSLKVNPFKSKIMMSNNSSFVVNGNILKEVDCFQYLAGFLWKVGTGY